MKTTRPRTVSSKESMNELRSRVMKSLLTRLIHVTVYHRQQPVHLGSIAWSWKWGHEHPIVPGEPIAETQMVVVHVRFCQVMLQCRRYVVGVTSSQSILLRSWRMLSYPPEVEILGHVYLLEHVHEPIFFGNPFHAVIVADWKDFGAFTMIHIVSA